MNGNEQYARACEGAPVDITPQQCRAARAGLDWSREQSAGAAGIAERTLTDFERQASNMLRKNKVALRKAFEAAGVMFDGSNGIWLPIAATASQSSGEAPGEGQPANDASESGESEHTPIGATSDEAERETA